MPKAIRKHAPLPVVAIVVSRYNASVTDALLAGAVGAFERAGGRAKDLRVVEAPGAFELVALSHACVSQKSIAGAVALGCIIKGETIHDEVIAHAVAQGLAIAMVQTGKPVALGVLTVNTPEQAQARAGGEKGNKGAEAMEALLETLASMAIVRGGAKPARLIEPRPDKARPAKARRSTP